MDQHQLDRETTRLASLVGDLFTVDAVYQHNGELVASLTNKFDRARSVRMLQDRLKLAGYAFKLSDETERPLLLTINPRRTLRVPVVNILLFIATLVSVYVVPLVYRYGGWEAARARMARGEGIEFTLAIISILFVHEMGHFIASRRRHIVTSWPYFIPAPNIIGTFGAIIKSKSPFWNRRDLIEVGAAGPIAGWIVALGWLIFGLAQSHVVPTRFLAPGDLGWSLEGESLLVRLLAPLLIGEQSAGMSYVFTEGAFAGWVGLLVTAINMLPIGQLDGGHIVYGLVRKRQRVLGWAATALLVALGFQSPMWWVFAAFGLVFGVAHPPTLDDERVPDRTAHVMGIVALVILVVSFTPVPFRA